MTEEQVYRIEEHGLVFDKFHPREAVVVMAGDDNLAKTRLIRGVFEDHPGFASRDLGELVEYSIALQNFFFFIRIEDLRIADTMRNSIFSPNSVFFFCFDLDDESSLERLERTWIADFKARDLPNMHSLLVGIKKEPEGAAEALGKPPEWASMKTLLEFCERHHIGWYAYCSTSDKSSMLNVFQIAINKTYPKVMLN